VIRAFWCLFSACFIHVLYWPLLFVSVCCAVFCNWPPACWIPQKWIEFNELFFLFLCPRMRWLHPPFPSKDVTGPFISCSVHSLKMSVLMYCFRCTTRSHLFHMSLRFASVIWNSLYYYFCHRYIQSLFFSLFHRAFWFIKFYSHQLFHTTMYQSYTLY